MKRVVSTLLLGFFVIFFEEVTSEVVITPVNVTVSENQETTLTCTLTGTSEAVKYFTWSYKRSSEQNEAPAGILTSTCSSLIVPINTSLYEYACPSNTKSTWTIKKVTRLNHGERYKCNIATSSGNENSEFTFLQVQVPISSVNMTVPSTESVTVNQNESREFKCKTSGRPTATVSWYKDSGTPRDSSDDIKITSNVVTSSRTANDLIEVTSTLTYSPSKNDNGWRIYCTASNINGQTPIVSSSKPLLNVQYPPDGPPVITGYTDGGEYHVIEGSQGQLSCSVSGGNPAPTLTWNCINSGSPQTINSGTVTMLHTWMAKRGQDRTCTCIASHYSGNKDVSIDITTLYQPTRPIFKINSTPVAQTVRVIRNNSLSVTCISEGKPEPSYVWTYPNRTTSVGSQLIVSSVQNNGKYTCDAQNMMDPSVGETVSGSNSSFLDVLILYPPVIKELKNFSVIEGLQAVISCPVTFGNPPETIFKWKRNGTIWKTSQNVTIETILRADAMIYTCFASNTMQQTGEKPMSQQDAKSFYLNIWYNTTVTDFFVLGHQGETSVTMNENDPVVFQCNADSNPGSTLSLIYKETITHTKTNIKSATFKIGSAGCTESGKYTCEGFNMYNVRNSTKHLILNINCLPRPSPFIKLEENVTSILNKPAVLMFTALAYPRPRQDDFRWYKLVNSTPLPLFHNEQFLISTSNLQSNLTIVNLNHTYAGMYKLEVKNSIGTYEQYFHISPEDVPEPPTSFRHVVELLTESSITVEWLPGVDNVPAQTFVLRYRKMFDRNWKDIAIQDTGALKMKYTVSGLTSGTMYYFTLYSYNKLGNSSEAEVLTITTKENTDEKRNADTVAGAIGGASAGLIIIASVVIAVVCYRRKSTTKGSRLMMAFKMIRKKKSSDENKIEMSSKDNPVGVYEQLQRTEDSGNRNVYDSLEDARGIKNVYENLKSQAISSSAYATLHAAAPKDESHATYENLKLNC